MAMTTAEVARLRLSNPFRGYYMEADDGVAFMIVALTEEGPIVEDGEGGALGLLTTTGEKIAHKSLLRCRVTFTSDWEVEEDRLVFGGHHVEGSANARVFATH